MEDRKLHKEYVKQIRHIMDYAQATYAEKLNLIADLMLLEREKGVTYV